MSRSPCAALLDLDGTLIDSDDLHYRAFVQILAEHGISLSVEEYSVRIAGRSNDEIFARLFPLWEEGQRRATWEAKERVVAAQAHLARMRPGASKFITDLRERGLQIGIVTNAPGIVAQSFARALLRSEDYSVIVVREDAELGKPSPDLYLEAVSRLRIGIHDAFAVEDTVTGAASAIAAGLQTFLIDSAFRQPPASDAIVVRNFEEILGIIDAAASS